jgi:hypothetical protein
MNDAVASFKLDKTSKEMCPMVAAHNDTQETAPRQFVQGGGIRPWGRSSTVTTVSAPERGCGDPGDFHKRVCPQLQEPTVMQMTLAFEMVSK